MATTLKTTKNPKIILKKFDFFDYFENLIEIKIMS
jgi:hypothetical protein